MGRCPRIEYEGAVYHVMSRGNRLEPVFLTDRDHEVFLDTLGEACDRCGWRVHAFALMGNHYQGKVSVLLLHHFTGRGGG